VSTKKDAIAHHFVNKETSGWKKYNMCIENIVKQAKLDLHDQKPYIYIYIYILLGYQGA